MKPFPLLLMAVAMAGVSCERHEFEGPNGTRQLSEHPASHETPADHQEPPTR